jgi:hypothetical protein
MGFALSQEYAATKIRYQIGPITNIGRPIQKEINDNSQSERDLLKLLSSYLKNTDPYIQWL